ncbi:MAG: HEAT repeat domain-containing protein, partial [Myxococcota bacterium]
VEVLLQALDEGSGAPSLRRSLARAVRRAGDGARAPLVRFMEADPPPRAAAAASLAVAPVEAAASLAARLLRRTAVRAERFEDRWRLVAAAAHLPADAPVDAWLADLVRGAEEWMLRAAALRALAHRDPTHARGVAEEAADDPYPRVRAEAAATLGKSREHTVPVATLARRDPWPLVRRKAVYALRTHPEALRVVRAAVRDGSESVRRTAIETLTEMGDRPGWPKVRDRLEDAREYPAVRSAAIAYVHRLCLPDGVAPLAGLVEEGLDPAADADQLDLAAAAVRALAAIGGERARQALARASAPGAPAPLRATAARARRHERPCR